MDNIINKQQIQLTKLYYVKLKIKKIRSKKVSNR